MKRIGDASRTNPIARWVQLVVGLAIYGVAAPLMIRSGLGLGPWDSFHVGVHNLTGISIGLASILTGLVIIIGGWGLGIRPGPGTLANMVLIGVFIDLFLPYLPEARGLPMGLVYYAFGIALAGLSTGMYMGAMLGNGPRDGLIVGLSLRTGRSVRLVRTIVELCALAGGWAMGGPLGLGTVLFAGLIGPVAQVFIHLFDAMPSRPAPASPAYAEPEPAAGG